MQLLNKIRWTGPLWLMSTTFYQGKKENPMANREAITSLAVTAEASDIIVITKRKSVD